MSDVEKGEECMKQKFFVGEKVLYLCKDTAEYSIFPVQIIERGQGKDRRKLLDLRLGQFEERTYDKSLLIKLDSQKFVAPATQNSCSAINLSGLDIKEADLSSVNSGMLSILLDNMPNLEKVTWPKCPIFLVSALNTRFFYFYGLKTDLFICDDQNTGNFLPQASTIIICGSNARLLWAINRCTKVQVKVGAHGITNPGDEEHTIVTGDGLFRHKQNFVLRGFKSRARL